MTILSNHRIHTYKATASLHKRDLSPKKTPLNKMPRHKMSSHTKNKFLSLKALARITKTSELTTTPIQMETRSIYVWGEEYQIQLPSGFDIYEGLRIWYPSLYIEVIKEEYAENNQKDNLDEDDVEAAWSHYEYLEWLCD